MQGKTGTPENSAGYFSEILAQVTVISLNTDSDAIICCKQVEVAVKMYDECGDCMCHYFKFTLVIIDIVNQNFYWRPDNILLPAPPYFSLDDIATLKGVNLATLFKVKSNIYT